MNRLLLSSILATGLALGTSGVFAADQYGNPSDETQQSENYNQSSSTQNLGSEGGEYTVQSGDTLSSIAEAELGSQDRWQEIARANDIENPDRIFEGQKLTIPAGQSEAGTAGNEIAGQQETAVETPANQNEAPDMGAKTGEEDAAMSKSQSEQSMDQTQQELKGEITEIGSHNDSFSVKDAQGLTHSFTKLEDTDMLEQISVGDFVKIQIENGTVVSLEKVEKSA
jgi:LysM repeat protein